MLKKIKSIIPLWLKVAVLHIVSDVKNYSFRVMIAHVYFDYVTYNKIEDKYVKAYEMRHKTVLAYLRKKGNHIINEYKNSDSKGIKEKIPKKVWMFWWVGQENMPDIVKLCVKRIQCEFKEFEIIVLDSSNLKQYISMPEYVFEAVKDKRLTLTHLSDITRMSILAKYGGIWMDATIFPLPGFAQWCEKHLENNIITGKRKKSNNMFVSDYKWTTYFCGGKKQYVLFPFVRDMLLKCVEEKQPFIDYYYMDYSIALAYRVFDEVKRDVDYMEYNNQNAEKMLQIINKKYDKEIFNKLCENTYFFKLSWKGELKEFTELGDTTNYEYLLKM